MKWKFWEKEDKLLIKIEELSKEVADIQNRLDEISTGNKQMNRLQYKYNQEIVKLLEGLKESLKRQEIDQELLTRLERELERNRLVIQDNSDVLIEIIDEIDLVRNRLSDKETYWNSLLDKWSEKILNQLESEGVYQLNLLHQEFNPRLAEAISTVNREELLKEYNVSEWSYSNHDIVEIVKRGYRDSNSEILRKALVVVYKEEYNEQESL